MIEVCLADRTPSTGRVFMLSFCFQPVAKCCCFSEMMRCCFVAAPHFPKSILRHFMTFYSVTFSERPRSRHKRILAKLVMFAKFLMAQKNIVQADLQKFVGRCWVGDIRVGERVNSARPKLFLFGLFGI